MRREKNEEQDGRRREGAKWYAKDGRDARILLRTATSFGRVRGRLILLHVYADSEEPSSAPRSGSLAAIFVSIYSVSCRDRRASTSSPFDTIGEVAFINGIWHLSLKNEQNVWITDARHRLQ